VEKVPFKSLKTLNPRPEKDKGDLPGLTSRKSWIYMGDGPGTFCSY